MQDIVYKGMITFHHVYNNSVNVVFALSVQTTVYNGMITFRHIEILITFVIFISTAQKHVQPATVALIFQN